MIKFATIGTSNICNSFIEGTLLTNRFILSAIYSRKYETGLNFGKKHNCERVFTSLEEMAKCEDIDAVYIASPNSLHYEQSRLMLENKKHVICEKPIGCCLEEYEELKALADEKGLIYMEAIIPVHCEYSAKVREAVTQIGDIVSARINFFQRSSRWDAFARGEQVNIFDMSLKAGALNDIGVYCVYAALDLLGEPEKITAFKKTAYNGADVSGCAVFEYDGFLALLNYGKNGQSFAESEIIGTDGTLKISAVSQYAGVTLIKNNEKQQISLFPTKAQLMSYEASAFADYIEGRKSLVDYEEASNLCKKVHKTMDEIKLSANLKYF